MGLVAAAQPSDSPHSFAGVYVVECLLRAMQTVPGCSVLEAHRVSSARQRTRVLSLILKAAAISFVEREAIEAWNRPKQRHSWALEAA